ncbi:MAG: hypothetical protein C5B56_02755, partial [Proteobacteria bacterium]
AAGTLISFSTQPGNTAADGRGSNSPFTKALLQHVATPNVDVLAMLRQVRRDVMAETGERQIPWDNSSLIDEFMFRSADDGPGRKPPRENAPEPPSDDIMLPPAPRPVRNGKPPVHACDRAAASATDPERVVAGNTMGELNGAEGVRACRAALAQYPGTPRFEFQLARSLHKTEAYPEAAQRYRDLVEHGYFAALTNYGWMLNFGHGVPRDPAAAVRLYMLAAQQGDMFGMYNVAMAYDTGSGLPFNPAQAASWIYGALRLGHGYSIDQMSGPAAGWTREFRLELQRLLKHAGVYAGPINGVFGPDVARAVRTVQSAPLAPKPGGEVPTRRFDPRSIPVNAPAPR